MTCSKTAAISSLYVPNEPRRQHPSEDDGGYEPEGWKGWAVVDLVELGRRWKGSKLLVEQADGWGVGVGGEPLLPRGANTL
jgi:hypothetical protein